MRTVVMECVFCETCLGCGRHRNIEAIECDMCGDLGYAGSLDYPMFELDGKELCAGCFWTTWLNMHDDLILDDEFEVDMPDDLDASTRELFDTERCNAYILD